MIKIEGYHLTYYSVKQSNTVDRGLSYGIGALALCSRRNAREAGVPGLYGIPHDQGRNLGVGYQWGPCIRTGRPPVDAGGAEEILHTLQVLSEK